MPNPSENAGITLRHGYYFPSASYFVFVYAFNIMSLSRLLPRVATLSRVTRTTQTLQTRWVPRAMYSAGGALSRETITSRILETLKGYEKVDPAKACIFSYMESLK